MNKKGFTLIELIVVITILSILGTIAFMSFKGFSSNARDSKVLSDIGNLNTGLSILKAKDGIIPIPDSPLKIEAGAGNIITYEGEIGKSLKNKLKASNDMITPTGKNYKYAVSFNQKEFTLVGFIEDKQASLTTIASAETVGHKKHFTGDKVLTVFDSSDNFINADIKNLSSEKVYLGEEEISISGTTPVLKNCKQILDYGLSAGDGNYKISKTGGIRDVFCDMTNNGGGWTYVGRLNPWEDGISYAGGYEKIGTRDDFWNKGYTKDKYTDKTVVNFIQKYDDLGATEVKTTWANDENYYKIYEDGVLSNQQDSYKIIEGRPHFDIYGFSFLVFFVANTEKSAPSNCYPSHFYHSGERTPAYTIHDKVTYSQYYRHICDGNPVPIDAIGSGSKWETLLYVR